MDQLDDIYIPQTSIWLNLLQPGWITLALLITIISVLCFLYFSRAKLRSQRKLFINYLMRQQQLSASQTNAILKAYISEINSDTQIAKMHGSQWRSFLLSNCNMQGYMQQLDYLADGYYQKKKTEPTLQLQHTNNLKELAIHWISNHKKSKLNK